MIDMCVLVSKRMASLAKDLPGQLPVQPVSDLIARLYASFHAQYPSQVNVDKLGAAGLTTQTSHVYIGSNFVHIAVLFRCSVCLRDQSGEMGLQIILESLTPKGRFSCSNTMPKLALHSNKLSSNSTSILCPCATNSNTLL